MGLRYEQAMIQALLRGVVTMKESVTYQAILKEGMAEGIAKGIAEGIAEGRVEGRAEEARKMLLLLGRDKFGQPPTNIQMALDSVADVGRLEEFAVRLNHASSWQEVFGEPGLRRRTTRKKPSD
jgi:predicted transposase YdaD